MSPGQQQVGAPAPELAPGTVLSVQSPPRVHGA